MKTLELDCLAMNGEGEVITRPKPNSTETVGCSWGYILVKALSGVYQPEQPLSEEVSDFRYELIKKCKNGGNQAFAIEELAEMKKCICFLFLGPSERGAAKEFLER